eukprot:3009757-Amphidinium_carterae.1
MQALCAQYDTEKSTIEDWLKEQEWGVMELLCYSLRAVPSTPLPLKQMPECQQPGVLRKLLAWRMEQVGTPKAIDE